MTSVNTDTVKAGHLLSDIEVYLCLTHIYLILYISSESKKHSP